MSIANSGPRDLGSVGSKILAEGIAARIRAQLEELIKPMVKELITKAADDLASDFIRAETIRDQAQHKVVVHFMFNEKEESNGTRS